MYPRIFHHIKFIITHPIIILIFSTSIITLSQAHGLENLPTSYLKDQPTTNHDPSSTSIQHLTILNTMEIQEKLNEVRKYITNNHTYYQKITNQLVQLLEDHINGSIDFFTMHTKLYNNEGTIKPYQKIASQYVINLDKISSMINKLVFQEINNINKPLSRNKINQILVQIYKEQQQLSKFSHRFRTVENKYSAHFEKQLRNCINLQQYRNTNFTQTIVDIPGRGISYKNEQKLAAYMLIYGNCLSYNYYHNNYLEQVKVQEEGWNTLIQAYNSRKSTEQFMKTIKSANYSKQLAGQLITYIHQINSSTTLQGKIKQIEEEMVKSIQNSIFRNIDYSKLRTQQRYEKYKKDIEPIYAHLVLELRKLFNIKTQEQFINIVKNMPKETVFQYVQKFINKINEYGAYYFQSMLFN